MEKTARLLPHLLIALLLVASASEPSRATPSGIAFKSTVGIGPPVYTNNGRFAADVAVLGDLNGDGNDELAVVNESNRVFILFMAADGSIASYLYHSLGSNGLPSSPNGGFKSAVESLGDLDGDGVVDIAVGDPGGGTPVPFGTVWILFLNANGTVKAHQRISQSAGGFTGQLEANSAFGKSIAFLGDIDGDGNKEIAVGSPEAPLFDAGPGKVWILDLSPAGLVTSHAEIPGVAGFTVSFADRDQFGSAVEAIPDLDGDGTTDLAIGAYYDAIGANPRTGSVWILFMNSDYSVDHYTTIGPGSGGLIHPPQSESWFGSALAWLPNAGCGRKALAVGAPGVSDAVWFLMLNNDGTVYDDYVMTKNDPSLPIELYYGAYWGEGLASLGDRDGNGITDLAVGTPEYNGRLYLVELETLRIEPRKINMGSVLIGEDNVSTFTITNNGCATREGPITVSGSNYALDIPATMSLAPGSSLVVPVRFAPTDVENPTALVSTPGGDVKFTGIGYFPACNGRWNIGTFNCANLDSIAGNHAMWCGVPGGDPVVVNAPGYGNGWNESLYFSAPAPYSHVPTHVELTFVYNSDLHISGDRFRVLTYHTGSLIEMMSFTGSTKDANGQFVTPGTGLAEFTVDPSDYIDLGGGQKGIAVVLNVLTDYVYSDEDFLDTKGAIQLDNVVLKFNGQVMSTADFEPGGSDGGWCNQQSYPTPNPSQNWSGVFGAPPSGKGLNGAGFSFTMYQGLLVVGGVFTQAGSVAAKRVAGWNGSDWQAFGSGIDNGTVWGVAEHEGSLVAAGSFTTVGGVPAARVARWDGTTWSALGAGFTSTGEALKSHNGLLYAGNGDKLSIWNGTAWSSVTAPGWIVDIEEYHGDLWVAGTSGFMARWNGVTFQDVKEFNNDAYTLHVHDDLLYVGGIWNIEPAPGAGWGVSAWDGTQWATPRIDYPLGSEGMTSFNGRLVLGGDFSVTSYEGALNVPMPGLDYYVRDVATYQGDLYATGDFTQAGGKPSRYIAKWSEQVVAVGDPALTPVLKVESFPNPFNPSMTIRVQHASRARLVVDIYDVGGRRVKRVANDASRAPGTVELQWDGTDDRGERTASGVYFLRVQSGRDVVTRKLVQIK
jgi:hypothetical protein